MHEDNDVSNYHYLHQTVYTFFFSICMYNFAYHLIHFRQTDWQARCQQAKPKSRLSANELQERVLKERIKALRRRNSTKKADDQQRG
jgi:hypothetical protein